ncbi:type II toxin-antitoxin system HicA family toxin [Flagellimonas sp.]|uniref:type II toxin-antitoxin system HicA family toxin n=1 Tax=Flagellimonas sp. TaxID=2058762 RepID=UPI003BAF383B
MAKVNELIKRLKKDGWYLYRHGKRHDIYLHPTKKGKVVIGRHGSKEIAAGTYYAILREAGIK